MQPDETPHLENRFDWPLPPDLIEAIQRIGKALADRTAGEPGSSSTTDPHEDGPAEPRFSRPPDAPRHRRYRKSVLGVVVLSIAGVAIWAVDRRQPKQPQSVNDVGSQSNQDVSQAEPERGISFLDWAAETTPEGPPITTRRWRVRATTHAASSAAPSTSSTSSAGDQHRAEPQPTGLMRRLLDEAFHELGF